MIWLFLVPIQTAFTLLALLVAPILPLFVLADGHFPKWLAWFDWPDNDIDGDRGWRTDLRTGSYARRVLWCWKNPGYNFDVDVCGAAIDNNSVVHVWGNPQIKNRDNGVAGWYLCVVAGYWNFKVIMPTGLKHCVMWELGWKMQDYAKGGVPTVKPAIIWFPRFTAFTK